MIICVKHGVEMSIFRKPDRRHIAPLHRCAKCAAEFRAALAKAMRVRSRRRPGLKQHTLPPVIMPGLR